MSLVGKRRNFARKANSIDLHVTSAGHKSALRAPGPPFRGLFKGGGAVELLETGRKAACEWRHNSRIYSVCLYMAKCDDGDERRRKCQTTPPTFACPHCFPETTGVLGMWWLLLATQTFLLFACSCTNFLSLHAFATVSTHTCHSELSNLHAQKAKSIVHLGGGGGGGVKVSAKSAHNSESYQ